LRCLFAPHISLSTSTPSNHDPDAFWPDGTPKKFRGRDAWKNWIDWDSPFRELTDELNRRRHFFWEVDGRGRMWKLEIGQPGERFGQQKHAATIDKLMGRAQPNESGLYTPDFPFVSVVGHEHYFLRRAESEAGRAPTPAPTPRGNDAPFESPVVFTDLRGPEGDGEAPWTLRHVVPAAGGGGTASSVTTVFDPASLRVTVDGRLLHPVTTRGRVLVRAAAAAAAPREPSNARDGESGADFEGPQWGARRDFSLLAALDPPTAQRVLDECEPDGEGRPVLRWKGRETVLATLDAAADE
jgi:hypothetical protein